MSPLMWWHHRWASEQVCSHHDRRARAGRHRMWRPVRTCWLDRSVRRWLDARCGQRVWSASRCDGVARQVVLPRSGAPHSTEDGHRTRPRSPPLLLVARSCRRSRDRWPGVGVARSVSSARRGRRSGHGSSRDAGVRPSTGVGATLAERYLHEMTVTHGMPLAARGGLAGRPAIDEPGRDGLFIAGDWIRALAASEVERPATWLTTVVTRLSIDRLRSAARRREHSVARGHPNPSSPTVILLISWSWTSRSRSASSTSSIVWSPSSAPCSSCTTCSARATTRWPNWSADARELPTDRPTGSCAGSR